MACRAFQIDLNSSLRCLLSKIVYCLEKKELKMFPKITTRITFKDAVKKKTHILLNYLHKTTLT